MLTLRDAAAALKVSERTVRREIADGRLSAVRIRKSFRISAEALENYIQGQTCQSGGSGCAGKSASALAAVDALNALCPVERPRPTRARSKIRSGAPRSTLRLVAGPTS